MDNNEIFIRNENEITIYNLQGIAKFNYKFDEVVYNIIPGSTSKRYYLIEENKTEQICIK
ncbi:MAG: hypothetical protein IIT65_00115 [Lachnospiraceae bacterium]|nr:hypothetical protein [Lachnospiraceae bacterium]